MITRKVGPALAAGCMMAVKAPVEAPLTALALAELRHRGGNPAGTVNIITGLESTMAVGQGLTTDAVTKKCRLRCCFLFELGGNTAFVVFEDADLDAAVWGLIPSKF
ncbi:succinate-semialdehyde dehydrogenase [Seiridium cupressi]